MANPNHKAALAVVVGASDNRSQPRGKVKQKAFSSPRKPCPQSIMMNGLPHSQGAPAHPRYSYEFSSPSIPNRTTSANQPNGSLPYHPTIYQNLQQSNGFGQQEIDRLKSREANGTANGWLKGGAHARSRLLDVEEALQYSPFSSIVPFSPDIIPVPNASHSGSQPIFSTPPEQRLARTQIAGLDKELLKTFGRPETVQQVEQDIKRYLDPSVITEFKFKPHTGLNNVQRRREAQQGDSGSGRASAPTLGPFAKLMLQATNLDNRYPTPTSPEGKTKPRVAPVVVLPQPEMPSGPLKTDQSRSMQYHNVQMIQQQSPVTPSVQRYVHNDTTFSKNRDSSVHTACSPVSTHLVPTPKVVIPVSSSRTYASDFVTHEDSTTRTSTEAPKGRQHQSESKSEMNSSLTKDQRTAANESLNQLRDLIRDIFEAEDLSQPNPPGGDSCVKTQYLVTVVHEGRETLTLSSATHVKLESLLHKLITVARFGDVPAEDLQHLQRLCESSLTSIDSLDFQIDSSWDAEGFASWISRLGVLDAALYSAKTTLRIMTGGREERQLYSEELLQNLLNVVKRVLDNVIIPIVEARSSGTMSNIFEGVTEHKKVISQLLFDNTKVMALLVKLLSQVEVAETIITGIEFFVTPLLFVENSYNEKDSILGSHKIESLRRTAMDLILIIFSRHQEQRSFLFNEILTSLQKLPVNERHARQYRLTEGKSVMLVSALIMELVQISAKSSHGAKKQSSYGRDSPAKAKQENGCGSSDEEASTTADIPQEISTLQGLSRDANFLVDNATKCAQYVVTFLIQRASGTAKTSESPHRQHLDMFVQDLIAVLGAPEWPAAELLLRMIFASCRNIAESQKSTAPAKNMALELLGMMGSAISDLVSNTRHVSKSIDNQGSDLSEHLRQMLDEFMEGSLESDDLIMWEGPYHIVVEYLQRNSSVDEQCSSAQAFHIAQWAKALTSGDLKGNAERTKLVLRLQQTLSGASWVTSNSQNTLTLSQSRLAYALTILSTGFCRQSDYILKILLDSITSEQITVRTRSLKSVDKMLEGDPSVLDRARNVKALITDCANDTSSMVRDSALTLVGKCINLRPALEQEFLRLIRRLTDDPAAGVRKRSIKMLKGTYLRNADLTVRTAIAESLLQRTTDLEIGVAELTRQTLEEIWLTPLWTVPDLADASAQNKVDFRNRVSLIVGTVRRGEKLAALLADMLKANLSENAKYALSNFRVCKSLVATAFDMMIDNFQDEDRLEQRHILYILTVFATANAKLFTPDQLQTLQPYIGNLSGKDDLEVFRSIVIIFRCVLPVLSNVQLGLLREIQKLLLTSISKLGKAELNEVVECLWTINGTLQNPEMLLRLTISVIKNLHNMRDKTLTEVGQIDDLKRVKKYIQIAGYFGKHCDFESHHQTVRMSFGWWKGQSVAELIVQSISPFATSAQPLSLKAEAFDSIGLICQSWPYQFTQENISIAFQKVLRGEEPELQNIVLSSFRDFFARINRQAEAKVGETSGVANATSGEKLGGSMTANEGDGASALIAQRFLKDILHIALVSQEASALTATEVIASINRQGLVHPKESGPALVALETSTNQAIADAAFQEHRLLHQQHESMFEREYMRAIQEAFKYQRDIVGDTSGYTINPYAAKLSPMFEIIKTSKTKYQKKFLSNFCSKIDFDVLKMDLSGSPPNVLQFSRFLTENLAFFEYGRLDELQHTIMCMEKIVADTGSAIAHNISIDVFNITIESMPGATAQDPPQDHEVAEPLKTANDPSRLRQLTTASIILSSLWETRTFLRRLYGLSAGQQRRDGKNKATVKDLSKAPNRVQGITGDRLVASIAEKVNSLDGEDTMTQQCRDFIELLSVDNEVKVRAESEEELNPLDTPSGDDEQDTPMSGRSHGVKRKGSVSIAGTPMKKKKGRPSLKRRRSGKSADSGEDWE